MRFGVDLAVGVEDAEVVQRFVILSATLFDRPEDAELHCQGVEAVREVCAFGGWVGGEDVVVDCVAQLAGDGEEGWWCRGRHGRRRETGYGSWDCEVRLGRKCAESMHCSC